MKSASAARPLLWPFVPAYRIALALRELQLRAGLKPVRRLRWPVVSIGNLSTGGAGKTPLTIALANALTARGLHVDVLSRGYGRRSALPLLVDPGGTATRLRRRAAAHRTRIPSSCLCCRRTLQSGIDGGSEFSKRARERGSKGASGRAPSRRRLSASPARSRSSTFCFLAVTT